MTFIQRVERKEMIVSFFKSLSLSRSFFRQISEILFCFEFFLVLTKIWRRHENFFNVLLKIILPSVSSIFLKSSHNKVLDELKTKAIFFLFGFLAAEDNRKKIETASSFVVREKATTAGKNEIFRQMRFSGSIFLPSHLTLHFAALTDTQKSRLSIDSGVRVRESACQRACVCVRVPASARRQRQSACVRARVCAPSLTHSLLSPSPSSHFRCGCELSTRRRRPTLDIRRSDATTTSATTTLLLLPVPLTPTAKKTISGEEELVSTK